MRSNRPRHTPAVLARRPQLREATRRALRSARRWPAIALCAAAVGLAALPQAATAWEENATLTASDPGPNAELGFDVAVSADGNTALVGAECAELNGNTCQGAAYVFTRADGAWSEQAKLVASDGAQFDWFGASVALSEDGNLAVVSAVGQPSGFAKGAVYVFTRVDGVWTEAAKLEASDGEDFDVFGWWVAMSGETIMVSTLRPAGIEPEKPGAVYVFEPEGDTWIESAKLTASDGFPGDEFGRSVTLQGDTAVIGMPGHTGGGDNPRGAAYVFTHDGEAWNEEEILFASDGTDFDGFGWSVAYADDTLVVGAYGDNDAQGSAYVFHHDAGTWSEQTKLVASDGVAGQGFGIDVAVSGDTALVGTLSLDSTALGSAYVFVRDGDTWSEDVKLVSPDGQVDDNFGARVALEGDTALVGEYRAEVDGIENAGAAHVFVREPVAGLSFDPSSLAFGDVEVGTTSPPQTATLSNGGDTDITDIVFSGLPDAGFEADTSACGDVLPAGGSCAVSVTFTPAAPGPAAATLHVDGAEGATADLELSGNGIGGGGPIADITPESLSFEVAQGGGESDTLSIGNLGDADLAWSLEEAGTTATAFVPGGAPYAYGLAGAPEFHAPVGFDRASGIPRSRSEAPADPVVLAAPQPLAIDELTEGFDDITQLPGAGWAMINNSEPVGPSSWFQGNDSIFPAHEGESDAYIAANYESVEDVGTISNWLITPEVTIGNGTEITFWTRTTEQFEEFFDRLEVRMSVAGDSTDVGETAESVGDFTELLLTINPDLEPGEYPEEWTQFTLTVRGRSRQPVTGRFAFRYFVTDAGPNGTNADYIGIDTVSVAQPDGTPPGGCDNPLDIPWLSADPTSGTTAPGASEPVTVTVDAADLEVGEHTALLCVTTNDPNAPRVEVPVSLTVTGGAREARDWTPSGPRDHTRLRQWPPGAGRHLGDI